MWMVPGSHLHSSAFKSGLGLRNLIDGVRVDLFAMLEGLMQCCFLRALLRE